MDFRSLLSSIFLSVLLSFYTQDVSAEEKPPKTLRMVHYMFRHGDRSPTRTYPGDPNPASTWHKGFGQLTTIGIQQHYALGQYMRERYDGFISKLYYNKEVYIRSTDVDRTLMSAQAHLAGLYEPQGEDVWSKDLAWQPIPVHTVPGAMDEVLHIDRELCPRMTELRKEIYNLPYFTDIAEKEKPFLEWISKQVGTEYTVATAYLLNDPIWIENLKNLTLPPYVNETVINKLFYLDLITFNSEAYTTEIQRIAGGGGPLVKDLVERIQKKISGHLDPDYKMYIYSAHDSTVSTFLHTLGAFNNLNPPYTATVLMELHELDNQYYLEFSYKNQTDHEPFPLYVKGCGGYKCPFEKFVEITKPKISNDLRAECQMPVTSSPNIQVVVFCTIAIVSTVIVLLQVVVIVLLRKRATYNAYRPVGNTA